MTTSQLFVPDKIKVGFQDRKGTYTGKLAYVIYYDKKGVLRKETSWQGWRDKKIEPVEFENVPTEGFVLNKGVGGNRESYGWNTRNEYIRVYDPRDFEFEISVANLLFILRECECSKGKGLEGKFVYAWDKSELVLLPEKTEDYRSSKDYTDLQGKKVSIKELILGASYRTRTQEVLTYLGKFDYFYCPAMTSRYDVLAKASSGDTGVTKRLVFWDGEKLVYKKDLKQIAVLQSDIVAPNYADLVDNYNKSSRGSKVKRLYLEEAEENKENRYYYQSEPWFYEDYGAFVECFTTYTNYNQNDGIERIQASFKFFLTNGILCREAIGKEAYSFGSRKKWMESRPWSNYGELKDTMGWREPTKLRLFAEMESGSRFRVTYDNFCKGG